MSALNQDPPPANQPVLIQRLKRYQRNLFELTKPGRPYSAMAKAFVAQFEVELERMIAEGA